MTTFQLMIDSILIAISRVMPLSEAVSRDLYRSLLKWPQTLPDSLALATLIGSLCFLVFFRFDWLGLFSALLKSIIKPKTLKPADRTLDQQMVIFLTIITLPATLAQKVLLPMIRDQEMLTHPWVMAGLLAGVGLALQFAANWNKRLKGLNHIKLGDAAIIGSLTLLSAHPAVPLIFTLWLGFALTNYGYEALFKYSMIAVGIQFWIQLVSNLHDWSLKESMSNLGHLNSIAMVVILITTFWMALEHLQKTINENTLKTFKWLNFACTLFYGVLYFIRG